ncbi:pantetheine-phosphate adenylyltransferase [Rickettsiales bacterium]|nr:pantetheine-phosphate adenylyltransferase [Rickettsiales bacterium]
MRAGIYPGTFDPITYGHIDIVKKALKLVDKLIIAVAAHPGKGPIFSVDERVEMVKGDVEYLIKEGANIEVYGFNGLLVDFANEKGADILIRGLRAVSDFEYEFQMSGMNAKMAPKLQTVFLPASESTHFIASRFVKEIARLNGDITGMVSDNVRDNLRLFFKK